MSIRKGNDIIASKPLIDAVPTQSSTNAVSSGGVYDALVTKQATISDLATIRSGAAAGATAVQPSDLATVATTGSYTDLLNKPTIPAAQVNSDWNANSGVEQILNKPTLATVATSGSYTDLSNKPTVMTGASAGDAGTSGFVPAPAAGDQQKFLQGDGNWATPTSSVAWGGITGTLSDQTDLQNALDAKVGIGHQVIDFQAPTAGNNYTWYRKYADGWVEQGGIQTGNGVYGKATVNLPVEMADDTYQAFGNIGWVGESGWYTYGGNTSERAVTDVTGATTDKTTTTFSIQSFSTHNWYVCGMAA